MAAKLEIADRVTFLGLRRDVADILAGAHIFVLSTNWEGFPLSILEAMRAGLPVVASDIGGVSEAVRHDETGYLVAPQNVEQLEARLSHLLATPEKRAQLGRSARAVFEDEFTFERMAQQTFGVYRDIVNSRAETS